MGAGEEEGGHKNGEEHRDQGVLATGEHALVVEGNHEERHARHEEPCESHIRNGPRLIRQVHHHMLPVLRVQPLIEQVHQVQPVEVHEARKARHVVWPESVLHEMSVHALDPVLVEVNAAGKKDYSCGINPVAKERRVRGRQQMRNVVNGPACGCVEGHPEVRRQSPDSVEPGGIDDGIDQRRRVALQGGRGLAHAKPHQLKEEDEC
mmetsp:Transcript_53258/g.127385  ORF Transcript_53258/g.127385 Transcript_53258/m.127385 type:complete len:207 (+) Transcript_53258:98-718(+)